MMKRGGFWAGAIAALCARAAFAVGDTTPPELTALSFPASVDVSSGPATVAVNYSATDDLSGVYYFAINFQGPGLGCGGAGASTYEYVTPALSHDGSVQFTLGQYSTPIGTYPICSLAVCDAVWNCHNYTVDDLAALGFPNEFTVTGTQDVTPPELTALSFPSTVDVSSGAATVTVNYAETDDLSGATSFSIAFQPPGQGCGNAGAGSGEGFAATLSRSDDVAFTLGQYSTPIGTYMVCSLQLNDAVGNWRAYTVAELTALGFPTQFTVTGTQDVAPPELTALSFPSTVDVTAGDMTVPVSYSETDDLSGAVSFYIQFQKPGNPNCYSGPGVSEGFAATLNRSGTVQFTLGRYSTEAGTYTVCFAQTCDAVGNCHQYPAAELAPLGFPTQFTVTGTQDTTAPVLTALSFPSTVDVSSGPATVTVSYSETDDLSGATSFSIAFQPPGQGCGNAGAGSGESFAATLSRSDDVAFTLGQYSTPIGTYVVCSLQLYDAVGNWRAYTVAELTALGFPTQFTVTGTQDTTAPVLTALSFPSTVDVSSGPATVTVSYSETDDLSGATSFSIAFQPPGQGCGNAGAGSGESFAATLSRSDDVAFTLGQYSTPIGTYVVCSLQINDAVGNYHSYTVSELQQLGFATQFTVTGTQDVTPPELTALSFPSTVDVSSGDATVTVDWSATDDLSGVSYFQAYFARTGEGCGRGSYQYVTAATSVSGEVAFGLGRYSTPIGTYVVCSLQINDAAGNWHAYTVAELTALGLPTQFTVTGTQDTTAPVLTALSFPSSVDVSAGDATVMVDWSATDDLSGVSYFQAYFARAGDGCGRSSYQYVTAATSVSGEVAFGLGRYSTPIGTYVVCSLQINDAVGNYHSYAVSELQQLGFPTQFTVTGTQDVTAPQLMALSFPSAVDVSAGDVLMTVNYVATDDLSGVAEFDIAFQVPGGGCWDGSYAYPAPARNVGGQVAFGLWQSSTPLGTYPVCLLRVRDAVGNYHDYTVGELTDLGFPTQFSVVDVSEACGNGVLQAGEQCDDGNADNNDACKNDCTWNVCGDGVVRTGVEQCDDGNSNNNDGCKNDCTLNVCGDGVLDVGVEECDDGNLADGDGCDGSCQVETCFSCSGEPSVCTPGPATRTVTNLNDDGPGSLRRAIGLACAGDTIDFAVTGTITLTSGELLVNRNLSIVGPSPIGLTVSGNDASRVFRITDGMVTIEGIRIAHANVVSGFRGLSLGAIGGGIQNTGTLSLRNVDIDSNTVSGQSGLFADGGGIYNSGALTILNTTVHGNVATGETASGYGGGIYNAGMLMLTNSTVSDNSAGGGVGGGIINYGALNLLNTTITRNSAGAGGGVSGAATAQNTIIAANSASASGANCSGAVTSEGHNLDDDGSCGFTAPGDLSNVSDAGLGLLGENGGPTQTHALLPGSPAIDAGDSAACPATDQRGVSRPQFTGCDIGAYEYDGIVIPHQASGYRYQVVSHGAGAGFEAPAFDDSIFSLGDGAFSSYTICPVVHTEWPGDTDILVRKHFTLPAGEKDLLVQVAVDNGVQVFINGNDISAGLQTPVYPEGCGALGSLLFSAPDQVLLAGDNVLAIRASDWGPPTYLDFQVRIGPRVIRCGDRVREGAEQCDDGNVTPGDGCNASCLIETGWTCSAPGQPCQPICGDGVVLGSEQCDDGNLVDGDGCDSNCTFTACGNGIRTAATGEQCDGGAGGGPGGTTTSGVNLALGKPVTASSTYPYYNAVPENAVDGDPTTQWGAWGWRLQWIQIDLQAPALVRQFRLLVSQSPDGDTTHRLLIKRSTPGADLELVHEFNGWTSNGQWLEFTPDTPINNVKLVRVETTASPSWVNWAEIEVLGTCHSDCTIAVCGDGVIDAGEQCDDGNAIDGDGCDSNCTLTGCGNGIVTAGEQCDDGNTDNTDACKNDCSLNGCSDGRLTLLADNFDTENGGYGASNYSSFANWDVTRGSVDLIGNGYADFLPGNGLYIDLDGSTSSAGRLESRASFALTPGTYQLEFRLAGSQRGDTNTVTVSLGSVFSEDFTFDSWVPFTPISREITVSTVTTARLVFDHAGGDNNGLLLDNVRLSRAFTCGNGVVEPGEQCDDGNLIDGDGCDSNCTFTGCGNCVVTAGEQCDDGNTSDNDACKTDCTPNVCGDGIVNPATEQCDDGNTNNNDACKNDCTWNVCGDGVLNVGVEECDDGNLVDGDGCDSNCTVTRCGNGVATAGEQCDDGNTNNSDACKNDCTWNVCGDGVVYAGVEQCDDGNLIDGDGCDSNCTFTGCGNGIVTAGEQCDDGNSNPNDACKNDCTLNICGDGVVQTGVEQCDDGNSNNNDGCKNDCTWNVCGDGVVYAGVEQCDDGNRFDGDGCDSNCTPTGCGNGILTPSPLCTTTAYSNDFESVAGSEWSSTSISTTPFGNRHFLGEFNNGTVSLTLTGLAPHTTALVSLDLFIIRSWDGNGACYGCAPDLWDLGVDGGPTLLHTTFSNITSPPFGFSFRQAYPDSFPGGDHPPQTDAVEVGTLGYVYSGVVGIDAVYHLGLPVTHTADTLTLNFSGIGLEDISNESWGLDNVRVELVTCAADDLNVGEQCDDGNTVSGDGCDSQCITEAGWTCPVSGRPCEPIATPTATPNTPTATPTPRAAGPVSPLYLTGTQFGGGPNASRIKVVQGDTVTLAFDEYGNGLSPYQVHESAIAVGSTVRTHGGSLCSGACDPVPKYVAEYTLSGGFIGVSNLGAIPYASPDQSDYLYDGTTDGTHNYAVGLLSGTVYLFDADWQNPTVLFALPGTLPSTGNLVWLGIAYDATNGTLWVSTHNRWSGLLAANFALDGTLLTSFNLNGEYNLATGLALDPADQTLWVVRDCTSGCPSFAVRLEQYSKQGVLLSISDNNLELQTFDSLGAEFAFLPVQTNTPTETPTATPPTATPTATNTASQPCTDFDPQCMGNGVCQADGSCQGTPINEGMSCDDFNPCTLTAQCEAGRCVSTSSKPGGSSCTYPGLGLCVSGGQCQVIPGFGAFCVPQNFVSCPNCQLCDPNTGQCTISLPCGSNPCSTGQCDSSTGECISGHEGEACDDSNVCTSNDRCQAGVCVGTVGGSPQPTATLSVTPTPTPPLAAACGGDCNGDGVVSPEEVITCVGVSQGHYPLAMCMAGDVDNDGAISPEEVSFAAQNSANGCPGAPRTPPTPVAGPCVGDCNGNNQVELEEIITCGEIALGDRDISFCPACDPNSDGQVTADEVGIQIDNYAQGCFSGAAATSTPTPIPTTATPAAGPAELVVNTTADDTTAGDGFCTLREAIANVNAASDTTSGDCAPGTGLGDTITFSLTLPATITLASGELLIDEDLTINGPGASALTVSGNNSSRVFNVTAGVVALSGITVANGNGSGSLLSGIGGGILNFGTLAIADAIVRGNTAVNSSGCASGICGAGGIANGGTLTLTNTTVSGNSAGFGGGGGIGNDGVLEVYSTTLSGNTGPAGGGGIANLHSGTATVTNSTVSGNHAGGSIGGGGIGNAGALHLINSTIINNDALSGGGVANGCLSGCGTTDLENTIVAANPVGGDCANGAPAPIVSNGHNLDDDGSCGLAAPGDVSNVPDPRLGPLADNGGPTQTHGLLPGSPAIDAGGNTACPATDQRGVTRPQFSGCDIGAYEYDGVMVPFGAGEYRYQVVAHGEGAGFEQPAFDDSAFSVGGAPFANAGSCPRTGWPENTDLLVRKDFRLPGGAKDLEVRVAVDNAAQVFINGQDISGGMRSPDYPDGCGSQGALTFTAPDAILVPGDNLLAVRGYDYGVDTYLDVQVRIGPTLIVCGDGVREGAEQCDDGNTNNDDACKNDCTLNVCGDGVQRRELQYRFEEVPFGYIDVSGTGISLGSNQVSGPIPLGFTFNFFGNEFSQVYISSNGFIGFDPGMSAGCCSGQPLPQVGGPDNLIAAFWTQLQFAMVTYGTVGDVFVIDATYLASLFPPAMVSLQYHLHSGTNQIGIHYLSTQGSHQGVTAGIENADGTRGYQHYNGASDLYEYAVAYVPVPPEQCDDGNLIDGDGCDSNCTPTGCGNGIVTAGEQCDDGNLIGGDGCSATCQTEPCYACVGQPSVCAPLPAGTSCEDGDACTRSDTCNGAGLCVGGPPLDCAPGGDQCLQGACTCGGGPTCGSGQRCVNGACVCDATSCPSGCCSGNTCMTPSLTSCGTGGAACVTCDATHADTCTNGTCSCGGGAACGSGQRCASGTCVCDATSCPSGCCSGSTCIAPPTAAQCGSGGSACLACGSSGDSCVSGACSCGGGGACGSGQRCAGGACVCDATSCPSGCCSGNTCMTPSLTSCGTGGAACVTCDATHADACTNGTCSCGGGAACGSGQRCASGTCVCDATSCPNGCCSGSTCVAPPTATQCGSGGGACLACGSSGDSCVSGVCSCGGGGACGSGQRCANGACVCDATSCPSGCCSGNTCMTPSLASCGTGGAACVSCDATHADTCTNGACTCGVGPACGAGQACVSGACIAPQTTLRIGRAAAHAGKTGVVIPVTTSQAITVGSTDVVLTFDPAVLQGESCSSTLLSSFDAFVDNSAGEIHTASASGSGDSLGAGGELFRCIFDVRSDAPRGPSIIGIRDGDGVPPDDLGGVSPPIPAPAILYTVDVGRVLVGAGEIACGGPMSALDASVLLCRFVGRCHDSDFPPPCNDPALRVKLSDWDCSGTLTPIDASITLAIVVGRIHFEDTPLVQGCGGGGGGGAASVFAPALAGGPAAVQPLDLEVTDARGRPGDVVTVEVRTRQAVTLGSTDLMLRYDRRTLEALSAESATLSGFTYGIDNRRGLLRTASATGEADALEAGATLFRVTFRVRVRARRMSLLRVLDGDGVGPPDVAGPARNGMAPESIPFTAHKGLFRLTTN